MPGGRRVSREGHEQPPASYTNVTDSTDDITSAVDSLEAVDSIDVDRVAAWAIAHPEQTYVLALVVGLSREKLKNHLRNWFDTASWRKAALEQRAELVEKLDEEFDLFRLLSTTAAFICG